MNNLVFLEPNKIDAVPFTTSDVIAQFAGVKHHAVQQLVTKHESDFQEFGLVAFKMRAVEAPGARGTKYMKVFHLTEEQATLLMTYLKNTPQVRAFKKELVRQFYQMRTELVRRQMLRTELKPIRRELTDVIQEKDPGPWSYGKYTNLAYKAAIGMTASQLRKARNAGRNAKAIDYMSSEEIAAVTKRQNQICMLLEMDMDYGQIKALVLDHALMGTIAAAAVTDGTA